LAEFIAGDDPMIDRVPKSLTPCDAPYRRFLQGCNVGRSMDGLHAPGTEAGTWWLPTIIDLGVLLDMFVKLLYPDHEVI
jgi:hypothetical protein